MDFHSLTRRELQSLCKLNKIPANITNVAMADALQSLEIVVGIEEFLNVSQSETADLVESVETVEVSSPKAPQTRCRTTTRQKAKPTASENLQPTVTRTTRRGSKQLPREVEESKNDLLKTPAVSRTSRKASATSTRRNVNNQLSECENEAKEEGLVEDKYSTIRSTRLTEKKSTVPRVKKGVEKAVKINSLLDQGNSNAEVEDICNAIEKLDVVVMEEEATHKSGEADEVDILKRESDENSYSCEDGVLEDNSKISESGEVDEVDIPKQVSDENSNSCEDGVLEGNSKISEVKIDEVYDVEPESDEVDILKQESDENSYSCDDGVLEDNSKISESGEVDEVDIPKQESDENSNSCEDGVLEGNSKISEVKIDEVYDAEPESDGISSPSEEAARKSGKEDEDCDEVSNLKQDLEDNLRNPEVKNEEVNDLKPDSDDTLGPCEDVNLVQKDSEDSFMSAMKEHNSVIVQEEHFDAGDTSNPCEDEKFEIKENNLVMVQEEKSDCLLESGDDAELGDDDSPCTDSEMVIENTENPINEIVTKETEEMTKKTGDDAELVDDDTPCADSEMIIDNTENPINEMSKNTVDETVVAIPTIDDHSTMAEEVEDPKPELFTLFTENNVNEKSDADSGPTQNPFISSDVTGHLSHVTPTKKDNKPEFFTENNVNEKSDVDMGPTHVPPFKNMLSVVSDDKENIVDEGKNRKKEKDDENAFQSLSIRQLKKQLKVLTLKSLNSKEEAAAAGTRRPALQALCENQMVVGGETEN